MPRARRRIISGALYELDFRARSGIPLPANRAINALIEAVIARAQRDFKVLIHHHIWNGNHTHTIVTAQDSYQLALFLKEVKKRLTDAIKQLFGVRYLNLWEPRATVARITSKKKAIQRIAYLYSNPSNDGLEDTIERFPGLSTFQSFLKCQDSLTASVTEFIPNFKVPALPTIGSREIGTKEELAILRALGRTDSRKRMRHPLTFTPNGWMKAFGVSDASEVSEINATILDNLRRSERESREARNAAGKSVLGADRLRRQPIMKPHTPKKHDRKIFFLGDDKDRRIAEVTEQRKFELDCKECYRRAKRGETNIVWPPGAFRPPLPPLYNVLNYFDDEPPLSVANQRRPKYVPVAA